MVLPDTRVLGTLICICVYPLGLLGVRFSPSHRDWEAGLCFLTPAIQRVGSQVLEKNSPWVWKICISKDREDL